MWTSIYVFNFLTLFSFRVLTIWIPSIPLNNVNTNSTDLFRLFNGSELNGRLISCVRDSLRNEYPDYIEIADRFQWTAVTVFRHASHSRKNEAWVIVAGNAPTMSDKKLNSVYTKQAGAVVGCNFDINVKTLDFIGLSSCNLLSMEVNVNQFNGSFGGLLGTGLKSIDLPSNLGNLLVYCDPLWHTEYGTNSPGGKCSIRHRKNGIWQKSKSGELAEVIHFCNSAGHTEPCAGGFSVDLKLSQEADAEFPNIQLLSGLPLSNPNGRAVVLSNLLRYFETEFSLSNKFSDIRGDKELFGSAVSFIDKQNYLAVSAPSVSISSPKVHSYEITNHDEALIHSQSSPKDILGTSHSNASEFGGFGFSLETISLRTATIATSAVPEFAVLVGAPFETVPLTGKNTGRVYLLCTSSVQTSYHDLSGSRQGEMFGYSISRIEDVDGDGIDDVAIGAPAIENESRFSGRVYIHRLLPECKLEAKPLQIINAPTVAGISNPPEGFGIAVSRGVDLNLDGSSEIAVSTLDPVTPVFLYSMPRKLMATCQIVLDSPLSTNTIKVGSIFEVTFTIRLTDLKSDSLSNIPAGLSSMRYRNHLLNPDVLWENNFNFYSPDRNNNNSEFDSTVDEFLTYSSGFGQLDRSQPRFDLEGDIMISSIPNNPTVITVNAKLRARAPGEFMNLELVPLKIAYKSIISHSLCGGFDAVHPACSNSEHPIVDWSRCSLEFGLVKHICPPFKQCSADLLFSTTWHENASRNVFLIDKSDPENTTIIDVPYGLNNETNRRIQLTLFNAGPTKSTGIRIELRALGWPKNGSYSGIRTKILSIRLSNMQSGVLLGGYGLQVDGKPFNMENQKLAVSISNNEGAAMITTKNNIWIYAGEKILLEVSLLLDGLHGGFTESKVQSENILSPPGLRAEIFSSLPDSDRSNNIANIIYRIVYKPSIEISVGSAIPALIDNRKRAHDLKDSVSSYRISESMLGPRLDHTYLLENAGNFELRNTTLRLDIPVYTKDGDILVYMSKRLRRLSGNSEASEFISTLPKVIAADGREAGKCRIEPRFLDPYGLTILETPMEGQIFADPSLTRIRREASYRASLDNSNFPTQLKAAYDDDDSLVKVYFKRTEQQQNIISCHSDEEKHINNGSILNTPTDIKVVCASIVCSLDSLQPADTVRIYVTGWLYAPTFFKLHLPDVRIVSRLSLLKWGEMPSPLNSYTSSSELKNQTTVIFDLPTINPRQQIAQSIVFRGASSKRLQRMLVWPILAGVFGGVVILTILIYLLCYCGFFRRRKHTNEAKRRASYRRSLMTGQLDHSGGALSVSLLDNGKSRLINRNGTSITNINVSDDKIENYNAQPMVKSSSDLVYAISSQPPSPCPEEEEEEDDCSTGHLVPIERQNQQCVTVATSQSKNSAEEYCTSLPDDQDPLISKNEASSEQDIASAVDDPLPEWLLGELNNKQTSPPRIE